MKNYLLILAFAMVSCKTAQTNYKLDKNAPIVDYNQPYEFYKQSRDISHTIQKHNDHTIFMYNNKKISHEKFRQLVKKGKINSMTDIRDKAQIEHLGYSYDVVKRIVFTAYSK